MKLFVVTDETGAWLEFNSSPWGDGECLVNDGKRYTLFHYKKDASKAIRTSKKYAKKNEDYELYDIWKIDEWKVISVDIEQ